MAVLIYVYGPPGCGKTRMIKDIRSDRIVYSDKIKGSGFVDLGANFVVMDNATKRMLPAVRQFLSKPGVEYVILVGNVVPRVFKLQFDFEDDQQVQQIKELLSTSCA